jgi:hypothetical protein
MFRRSGSTWIVAAAAIGIFAVILALGTHGLMARDAARATAQLPVLRMETVTIVGERMQAAIPATQVANSRLPTVR